METAQEPFARALGRGPLPRQPLTVVQLLGVSDPLHSHDAHAGPEQRQEPTVLWSLLSPLIPPPPHHLPPAPHGGAAPRGPTPRPLLPAATTGPGRTLKRACPPAPHHRLHLCRVHSAWTLFPGATETALPRSPTAFILPEPTGSSRSSFSVVLQQHLAPLSASPSSSRSPGRLPPRSSSQLQVAPQRLLFRVSPLPGLEVQEGLGPCPRLSPSPPGCPWSAHSRWQLNYHPNSRGCSQSLFLAPTSFLNFKRT